MVKKQLILITLILVLPLTAKAIEPIVLEGERMLIDESKYYEIDGVSNSIKSVKKIPNITFKDSVVLSFKLFNPKLENKNVVVELANPLLYYVKLSSFDGEIITGRHLRNKKSKTEKVNEFRNFRFDVCVSSLDTIELVLVTKSVNFYQPLPLIVWNESPVFSDVKNNLTLGTIIGLLYWIIVLLPFLLYLSKNKVVFYFLIYTLTAILAIGYHLGFVYNLVFNLKSDTLYHTLLVGLQINFAAHMSWSYLISFEDKNNLKKRKIVFNIISGVLLLIFLLTIGASLQVEYNLLLFKRAQFLLTISTGLVFVVFLLLGPLLKRNLASRVSLFLVGMIVFGGTGIGYILQKCILFNFQFGLFGYKEINIFPINTVLPQLYCYSFFLFMCVLLLLLFWHYQEIEKSKVKFEKLTQTTQEEYPLALLNADQKDRTKLSQGLHDNIGVLLSIIKVKIGDLNSEKLLNPEASNRLITQVNRVTQYVRDTSNLINPSGLEYVNLEEFFRDYFDELGFSNPKVKFSINGCSLLQPIEGIKKNNLYRIISFIIPNKDQAKDCNLYNISIRKTNTILNLNVDVIFNEENEWDFLEATKNRFKTLDTIVTAYRGNLRIIEQSKTNYIIKIDLLAKYFY